MANAIRFDIIGAVGRGSGFVRWHQSHAGTELTAMCDITQNRLATLAAEVEVSHTFTDAEAMVGSGGVDVVNCGCPGHTADSVGHTSTAAADTARPCRQHYLQPGRLTA